MSITLFLFLTPSRSTQLKLKSPKNGSKSEGKLLIVLIGVVGKKETVTLICRDEVFNRCLDDLINGSPFRYRYTRENKLDEDGIFEEKVVQ